MPVQPFHSHGSHWNSQPIEGDSVDESSGDGDGGGDAHGGEGHGQRGFDRAKAAWLYAQFVTSKTVDVKKSHVGLTLIRESTIQHKSFTDRAPKAIAIVGMQPVSMSLGMELSPEVAAQVPQLVAMTLAELAALGIQAEARG